MNCIWTEAEKKYILQYAEHKKDQEIAQDLQKMSDRHISIQSVRKQRRKLGIIKCNGRGVCKIKK